MTTRMQATHAETAKSVYKTKLTAMQEMLAELCNWEENTLRMDDDPTWAAVGTVGYAVELLDQLVNLKNGAMAARAAKQTR